MDANLTMSTLEACPRCNEQVLEACKFCENCGCRLEAELGIPLSPTVACRCGAGVDRRDSEGYCEVCGRRFDTGNPRDHLEEVLSPELACVTDKGCRHKKNEDAFALGIAGNKIIIVVCDGVSSASHSDEASQRAADTARGVLQAAAQPEIDSISLMKSALGQAHLAVCQVQRTGDGKLDPPGTTFVAAMVENRTVTLGWAGDSRAYWFDNEQSQALTQDHSWLNDIVSSGKMSLEEALAQPLAHAITQCLGPLNEEQPEGSYRQFQIPGPGRLLLCSDGLWGYTNLIEELVERIPEAPPIEVARSLTDFALSQGGRDNITVAVLQVK